MVSAPASRLVSESLTLRHCKADMFIMLIYADAPLTPGGARCCSNLQLASAAAESRG